ncbi:flagellar hook-length control protein FliK [Dongia sp.]|uniref:flagellar hook-length control protein FliK n=1 Tax=Dongia sp. TaxID=1977262 RepID=UPI0035AFD72C
MGSMDTSRIGQFFGLAPKVNGIAETGTNQSGGFADLLFGVMSKRVSTAQPPVTANKVTTVLPIEHRPDAVEPLTARPLASPRALDRAHGIRGNEQAAAPADQSSGSPGTGNASNSPLGDKKPGAVEAPAVDCAHQGESIEAAPPAEGVEIGEDTGEDLDLQTEAEGTEGQEGGTGEQSADPSLDQQPQAAVIEIWQPTSETPQVTAPIAVAGAMPVANDPAAPELNADADEAVAPTQPIAAAEPAQEEIAAAQPGLPAEGENASVEGEPATAAPAIGNQAEDDIKTAAAAEMALSLAEESSTGEAEAKAGAMARQNEHRQEDSPGTFRRSAQTPRQRAATASAGTTGTPAQAPAQNAAASTNSQTGGSASAGAAISTVLPLSPLGFEGESGTISGIPGWNLNLGQGNAAKRADFVANLRQHLQNLPAREQVALGIQRAARDGSGSITLQLSPSELGRIHVKLEIDEEKNVRAAVSVERPATLDLLQRDVKALERALQDAGLKMDQGDLSFSLQQGGDGDSFAREFGSGGGDLAQMLTDGSDDELAAELAAQSAIVATGDGLVDVQI